MFVGTAEMSRFPTQLLHITSYSWILLELEKFLLKKLFLVGISKLSHQQYFPMGNNFDKSLYNYYTVAVGLHHPDHRGHLM